MKIGIAADHQGFLLKKNILGGLRRLDFQVTDYGAFFYNADDDFPDFIIPLARAVSTHDLDRGIAICGTGIGVCIAANKLKDVRAGIVQDVTSAEHGVLDDDMNLLCLGARLVDFARADIFVQQFLRTHFSGKTRFERRLAKIARLEEMDPLFQ